MRNREVCWTMVKLFPHKGNSGKAVLMAFCLLFFGTGAVAQYVDTVPAIDTSIKIEDETATSVSNRFETATFEDQQPVLSRRVDSNRVANMKKDEAFWYINTVPPKAKRPVLQQAPEKRQDPEWLRNLLWVLVVGGFVVLIIWFLVSSDVQLFRKTPPVVAKPEDEEEYTTENLFDIDYNSALKRAVAARNYRLAIRLLYLQTLKDLALHNLIQFRQERTNSDYLVQLFSTAYYKDFFRLTRNFEYAWYGKFDVSQPAYELIEREFYTFKQRMPS